MVTSTKRKGDYSVRHQTKSREVQRNVHNCIAFARDTLTFLHVGYERRFKLFTKIVADIIGEHSFNQPDSQALD